MVKCRLQSNLHTKIGWLHDLLVGYKLLKADDNSDYSCQLAYVDGMKGALGGQFQDPREYKGKRCKECGGRYIYSKTVKHQVIPKNVFTIPHLMRACEVSKCTFKWRPKERKIGIRIVDGYNS
jgi:hypothetical protein